MSRGELIKTLRTRRSLTQSKLAKLVKMSLGGIQSLEADNRRGKGMHEENALRMLAELHHLEPLTGDEIEQYIDGFALDRHIAHNVLSGIDLPESVEGMRPDTKALFLGAAGELSQLVGESAALEIFEKITRIASVAATDTELRVRNEINATTEAMIHGHTGTGKAATLVDIAQRHGAIVETRTPHDAAGNPLRPVPAGEGVIDDPNLALADRLKVVEEHLRKAAKPGEKLSAQELADHLKAIGQDLKRTGG